MWVIAVGSKCQNLHCNIVEICQSIALNYIAFFGYMVHVHLFIKIETVCDKLLFLHCCVITYVCKTPTVIEYYTLCFSHHRTVLHHATICFSLSTSRYFCSDRLQKQRILNVLTSLIAFIYYINDFKHYYALRFVQHHQQLVLSHKS